MIYSHLFAGADTTSRCRFEHPEGILPALANNLDLIIRNLIGMDESAVKERFQTFVNEHPALNCQANFQFLRLLQNLIAKNGGIALERLMDAPFTQLHPEGVYGVFADEKLRDELIRTIEVMAMPMTKDINGDITPS